MNSLLHILYKVCTDVCIAFFFFYALSMCLKKDLERVEKWALSIICPGLAYREAIEFLYIDSILDYIANLCKKTFSSIANDPAHRLHSMLPF